MNPTGLGLGNRPATDQPAAPAPAPASGLRARLEANRRVVVLAAAGVLVAAAGGAGWLLLGGGSADPASGTAVPAAAGRTAAPTASATVSASPTPTEVAGTRNPFVARPAASGSGSTGASGSSTTGRTATTTVTDPAVYLALFSVAADGTAKFSVNGTTYSQRPGDTFGPGKALSYHKKVTVSGVACASVGYQDQTTTVCPGEMHQVA